MKTELTSIELSKLADLKFQLARLRVMRDHLTEVSVGLAEQAAEIEDEIKKITAE